MADKPVPLASPTNLKEVMSDVQIPTHPASDPPTPTGASILAAPIKILNPDAATMVLVVAEKPKRARSTIRRTWVVPPPKFRSHSRVSDYRDLREEFSRP